MKVRNMMKMGVVAGVCAFAMTAGVLSVGGMAQSAFASEDDATLNATTENALASEDDATLSATTVKCSAMHRLYNKYTGEHFYTASGDEKNNLVSKGWNYEGIGWAAPKKSNTPVYRLYNSYAGDHHYTLDVNEKNNLVSKGWTYEGIGWYSDDNKEVALLRQYNPNATVGTHNFTTSTDENKNLKKAGWSAEGVSWYGVNHTYITVTHPAVTHKEPVYEVKYDDAYYCCKHEVELLDLTVAEKCAIPGRLGYCPADPKCLANTYLKYNCKQVKVQTGTQTVTDKEAYTDTTCSVCGEVLS